MAISLLLTIECSDFSPRVSLSTVDPGSANPDQTWQLVASDVCPADARSAAALVPMIRDLYDNANLSQQQTTAVAVTYGPGSFTSLRIGVTTAKMLAYCWKVPAIGINTLDWLLAAGLENFPANAVAGKRFWAVTNAYRKQFFYKSITPQPGFSLAKFPEQLASKRTEFDAHFESAFALADSFDGDAKDDQSARFDLNEESIQKQESQFPEQFWTVDQATDVIDSENWIQQISASGKEPQVIVVSDQKLAESLQQRLSSAGRSIEIIVPNESARNQALSWLALQSMQFLSAAQMHPFHLQPIYYRPSAAEEAWAAKS